MVLEWYDLIIRTRLHMDRGLRSSPHSGLYLPEWSVSADATSANPCHSQGLCEECERWRFCSSQHGCLVARRAGWQQVTGQGGPQGNSSIHIYLNTPPRSRLLRQRERSVCVRLLCYSSFISVVISSMHVSLAEVLAFPVYGSPHMAIGCIEVGRRMRNFLNPYHRRP